ncbi:MAG TPA: methionyl-tRNA formyltransferase [Dehalococcoidia bacterium]|nr:methionyl-tRNA formyltransferase [Dehalococcoidia bacterium]
MRVVFMGSPDFALPTLQRLIESPYDVVAVYTQPDRPAGRGRHPAPPPAKLLAQRYGIPVYQPERVSAPEEVERLRALAPDVIVIAAYGQILRPAVLEVPRHGTLNVHASLLPRWRGASPVVAAILAGDRETGVTIMLVEPELDAGPILAQAREPICEDDTAGTLGARLAQRGADLLIETLPRWLAGAITPMPQDPALATYAPTVKKEDGRIDWTREAAFIERQVRAYQPWPVAYTTFRGDPLRIFAAHVLNQTGPEPPGTVVAADGGFAVRCGEGTLVIDRAQLPGRRPLPAADLLRGRRDLIGATLGT